MDPNKFYGKSRKVQVREIPDDSEDSELSSSDDENPDEAEWNNSNQSSSDSEPDDNENEAGPGTSASTSSRPIIWKQRIEGAELATAVPEFLGKEREPLPPRTPIEYFNDVIKSQTLQTIVAETNRYSLQKDINKPVNTNLQELEQFLGMIFYMSIVKIPRARMYWSPKTRVPHVADIMCQKRFEEVKRNLHLSNNEQSDGSKLYKIQFLLDAFKASVQSLPKSQMISIDKQVIPFKGKSALKQYNPKKPKKWGYKVFICSGQNGLIHNFEVYTGKINPCPGQPDLGASGNIVLQLLNDVPQGVWHQVYFDNWFNSIPLQMNLWKAGIACLGTVRLKGCTFPPEKELLKQGRDVSVLKTSSVDGADLKVVKWVDNKSVTMLSTFAGVDPVKKVKRWDKKQRRKLRSTAPPLSAYTMPSWEELTYWIHWWRCTEIQLGPKNGTFA